MKTTIAILSVTLGVLAGVAVSRGSDTLSRDEATKKLVAVLLGDPYGETEADVVSNLTDVRLVPDGTDPCSGSLRPSPVWSFSVKTKPTLSNPEPLVGTIDLDAATGEVACTDLPLFD